MKWKGSTSVRYEGARTAQKRNEYWEYERLVSAIIRQTCKDYLRAKAPWKLAELRDFFFGSWFAMMTDLDPDYLVGRLDAMRRAKEKLGNVKTERRVAHGNSSIGNGEKRIREDILPEKLQAERDRCDQRREGTASVQDGDQGGEDSEIRKFGRECEQLCSDQQGEILLADEGDPVSEAEEHCD